MTEPRAAVAWTLAVLGAVVIAWLDGTRVVYCGVMLAVLYIAHAYRLVARRASRREMLAIKGVVMAEKLMQVEDHKRRNAERGVRDLWDGVLWMMRSPGRRIEVTIHSSDYEQMVEIEHHTPN